MLTKRRTSYCSSMTQKGKQCTRKISPNCGQLCENHYKTWKLEKCSVVYNIVNTKSFQCSNGCVCLNI